MKALISRLPKYNKKYMYDSISENLKNGESVYIVVPEQFTLGSEIEAYSTLKVDSTLKLRIKSFRTIVDEVLDKFGGRAKNFISENSQILILKLILEEQKNNLRVYNQNINDDGFINLLLSLIKELKSNNVNSELLRESTKNLCENLKEKIQDLSLIFEKYEKKFSKSKFDEIDKFNFAKDLVLNFEEYRDINFYFDRFNSMSEQEVDMLKNISTLAKSSYINITMDYGLVKFIDSKNVELSNIKDFELFETSRNFLKKLSPFIEYIDTQKYKKNELTDVEQFISHLFSYEKAPELNKKNIFLKRYSNTKEEVENLTISIKKDVFKNFEKGETLNYKDIAVITTNPQEYYNLIKMDFLFNDIPFFIDEQRNLLENPMIKYLTSSLALIGNNFKWDKIIQFLKYSFLDINFNEISDFQNYLENRKIRGKMIFDDKYFDIEELNRDSKYFREDKLELENTLKIRKIFLNIVQSIEGYEEIFSEDIKRNTLAGFVKILYKFISNPYIFEKYEKYQRNISKDREVVVQENLMVWNKFMDILDDINLISDDSIVDFKLFNQIIKLVISNIKIGIIPPGQDQVIVGDITRSRLMNVKKIYVLGMSNIYYPIADNSSGIISDHDKEELINNGIFINSTKSNLNHINTLSFYEQLSLAKKEIVFSYSLINDSNEAMTDSYINMWIRDMIHPSNNINDNILDNISEDITYSKTKLSVFIPKIYNLLKQNKPIKEDEYNLFNKLIFSISKNKKYDFIEKSIKYIDKEEIKNISGENVKKIFNKSKVSISQLEDFRRCPYKHYVSYGLKPRQKFYYSLNNLDMGNITHEIAEEYINNLANGNSYDIDLEMDKIIKKNVDSYKLENQKNNFFIGKLKKSIKTSLNYMKNHFEYGMPNKIFTEIKYGENSIFPAIEVEYKGEKIKIEGKIDRVDQFSILDKEYFRVIDYKTGKKEFDLKKVEKGIDIQLIIYLYSATQYSENSEPLGCFFIKMNDNYTLKTEGTEKDYYKLDGLLLKDREVLSNIDSSFKIETNKLGDKEYLNSDLVKTGRKNIIGLKTLEEFNEIFNIVLDTAKESIEEIKDGNISIFPYRYKNTIPCSYCEYKSICQLKIEKYNYLDKTIEESEELEESGD